MQCFQMLDSGHVFQLHLNVHLSTQKYLSKDVLGLSDRCF